MQVYTNCYSAWLPKFHAGQRPHSYGCRTGTQAKRQEGPTHVSSSLENVSVLESICVKACVLVLSLVSMPVWDIAALCWNQSAPAATKAMKFCCWWEGRGSVTWCLVRYYVGRTVQVCWQTREGGKPTNCALCWQTCEGGGVVHYCYLPGRYRLGHNAIGHCGSGDWSMGHCGFGDCPIGLWIW